MTHTPPTPTTHTSANKQPLHWGALFSLAATLSCGLLYLRLWYFDSLYWPRTVFRSESRISENVLVILHFGSIFAIWLLTFTICLVAWRYVRVSSLFRRVTWFTLLISVPVLFFSLILCFALVIFGFPDGMSVTQKTGKYDIGILQTFNFDPYPSTTLWFIVIREDEWYYAEVLDQAGEYSGGDYTVCDELSLLQQQQKVYFLCDNESISPKTPYFDSSTSTIFIGWGKNDQEQSLEKLPFKVPAAPPRVVQ